MNKELQTRWLREAAARCAEGGAWMSIPARPDVDADLLLVRAADELDRLRTELAVERDEVALKSACIAGMSDAANKLAAERDALRAELAEAQRDAIRARLETARCKEALTDLCVVIESARMGLTGEKEKPIPSSTSAVVRAPVSGTSRSEETRP